MNLPTVDEVADQLERCKRMAGAGELDVRLQVYENGAWVIRIGDAQYDTDHHGYWGVGVINATYEHSDLIAIADDLLEQVQEFEEQALL